MSKATLMLVAAALLLVACEDDPVAAGGACKQTSECVQGLQCLSAVCAKPKPAEPPPQAPATGMAKPIRDAKEAGKTAQDGVDKRMDEILGK